MAAARIAIVDSHALIVAGVLQLLGARRPEYVVVYAGADAAGAVVAGADVVLFDPAAGAPEPPPVAISRLVSGGVSVVAVSQVATPADAVVALAAGASGYVATRDNPTGLVAALDAVLAGERWVSPELAAPAVRDGVPALSNQERRAVVLYTSGLKLDSVARAMGVKPSSVKQYLDRVRAKYAAAGRRVSTRYDLTEAAVRDGLIPPPGSS